MSTTEWIPSESMAELPVKAAAKNLVMAIREFPIDEGGKNNFFGSRGSHKSDTGYVLGGKNFKGKRRKKKYLSGRTSFPRSLSPIA